MNLHPIFYYNPHRTIKLIGFGVRDADHSTAGLTLFFDCYNAGNGLLYCTLYGSYFPDKAYVKALVGRSFRIEDTALQDSENRQITLNRSQFNRFRQILESSLPGFSFHWHEKVEQEFPE